MHLPVSRWICIGLVMILSSMLMGCQHDSGRNRGLAPILPAPSLLLDVDAFPPEWTRNQCEPDCNGMEQAGNAVRQFYRPHEVGVVVQNVYRYQTLSQAESEYARYRSTQFNRSDRAPSTEFTTPADGYISAFADEQYLACGVSLGAECRYLARYQQYMIYSVFDMESWNGYGEETLNDGLTMEALNIILKAQDSRVSDRLGLSKLR